LLDSVLSCRHLFFSDVVLNVVMNERIILSHHIKEATL